MPKLLFLRHKIIFCTNNKIPEELLAKNIAYFSVVCSAFLKKTWQAWKTTADEHYLKVLKK